LSVLSIRNLRKTYDTAIAVDDFSIDVPEGEFLSLLGPSGCGKTTILRMIAGLIEPDRGQIIIGGQDVTRTKVNKRNIGLVFQSYALFPHMSVYDNVAFGLRRRNFSEADIRTEVTEVLAKVHLDGLENRYPRQMSGGQQQRVALARAIVPKPSVLLLDEPLSNLDKQLRLDMQVELKRLQQEVGLTTIFVTHDQSEAMALSDRICVLNAGAVQQIGVPEDLYHSPQNRFVATFLGRSNAFEATICDRQGDVGATLQLVDGFKFDCDLPQPMDIGTKVHAALRHEAVRIISEQGALVPANTNTFKGKVTYRAFSGAAVDYLVALENGPEIMLETSNEDIVQRASPGTEVLISWDRSAVLVNGPET